MKISTLAKQHLKEAQNGENFSSDVYLAASKQILPGLGQSLVGTQELVASLITVPEGHSQRTTHWSVHMGFGVVQLAGQAEPQSVVNWPRTGQAEEGGGGGERGEGRGGRGEGRGGRGRGEGGGERGEGGGGRGEGEGRGGRGEGRGIVPGLNKYTAA